ncbi:putative disease resistance protein [Cardamine amara subsp. amara]|uniref:Disease resistance protein n=1 Tax=Cardamine amara subsp. amara TaxID=228776 RepID=A0ABD1C920_CARAN
MAETTPDPQYRELRQKTKDENLCKEIVGVLGRDGPQRVLLAGEAGIGKTRLAKKVGEHAVNTGPCFLTLCLHLNKKCGDEWSLYENIASQLSVYSDFEETEVDDRDEDEEEEKKADVLLADLKKNIIDEIVKRAAEKARELAAEKARELAAEKAKELTRKKLVLVDKKAKDLAEKKGKKPLGDGDKQKPTVTENKTPTEGEKKDTKPYLLLILDDEGNKASANVVMKDLKLEKFLIDEILKEDTRLKVLVTRRKGDEEPTKPAGEIESHDKKSDQGNEEDNKSDQGNEEDTKSDQGSEEDTKSDQGSEEDTKSDQGNEEDTKSSSKAESAGEIESQDKDNEEETGALATSSPQITEHEGGSVPTTEAETEVQTKCCYDTIDFQSTDKSKALLNSISETNLTDLFVSLIPEDWKTEQKVISEIVKKSKNSPASIVVLAKSLKWITRSTSNPGKDKLKKKIDEVLSTDRSDLSDPGSSSESAINPIMYLAYELLKTDGPLKDAILDCFWHSLDFFEHCGCVYYRDLITQWMLEGYFDPVRSVEKAYQDGHSILMELINRGMLKIQENNVVVPEMAMSNLIDPRRRGHLGRSRLGFSRVYGGDKDKGIGKITQIDDMIKTVQAKKGDKVTTILVSGDRLRRVTPEKYFAKLNDLEVLGLFEPTLEPFVPSFLKLHKLRVLVIRDCDLLKDIEDLKDLQELQALEVSGASSLKKISDEFFKALSKLQSLHLSGLQITSSPSSISELTELHCLIIKDCPLLEDLPDIQELKKLEVVDISGARGLQTCFDNTKGDKKNKSKNKNFYHLTKLQLLDFSESQIERLPIFQDSAVADKLHSLTRLLLRNCSKLRRLPSLKPLSGLQILDLSGTTSLVEMLEVCFEDKEELKILNLSGTNLSELATTIEELSGLNELLLSNCTNLEVIPNIQKLTNLEVIDVSGSTKLEKIEGSFEDMSYLREVNLSGTKVETPELPKETKIIGPKRIILADGRSFEGNDWSEVREKMSNAVSEDPSSSSAVVKSQEISEETKEIQSNDPHVSGCTEKGDISKERLLKVPVDKALYVKTLSFFDSTSPQEVMEINETNELDDEAIANAESVSFVDCSSTRLTSIFNKTKSVKCCWLKMCIDITDLFSGVAEEHLKSLETLSITNLPSLEKISCVGNLENLKNLSLDCCPKIKTIFSEMPSSLQVLNVKHCEKLEKVVEGVQVSTLTNLTVNQENCPNFEGNSISSGWEIIEPGEASSQE